MDRLRKSSLGFSPCHDEHIVQLYTDGNGDHRCLQCWTNRFQREEQQALEHQRRAEAQALTQLGLTDADLSLSDRLEGCDSSLTERLVLLRLRHWTTNGGACFLYGPDQTRDLFARAATRELWSRCPSDLQLTTGDDWIQTAMSHDRARGHQLARAPWLIVLDIGLHQPKRGPTNALYDLLRQRHVSRHVVGTLFVSHLPPDELMELLETGMESRHAADLFDSLFTSIVSTTGGAASHRSRLLSLEPSKMEWLAPLVQENAHAVGV